MARMDDLGKGGGGGVVDRPPPFTNKLDAIGNELLRPGGPDVIRVTEKLANGRSASIYFFARVAKIEEILQDDQCFSLSHYDDALAVVAGDVRFLLGVDDDDGKRHRKVEIIQNVIGKKGVGTLTKAADLQKIARECARRVTQSLVRNGDGEFNVVRDFGYFVPYLVASRFLGVWGPPSPTLLVRAFLAIRNELKPGYRVDFTPEMTPCHVMVTWSHLIMGHIFSNFENRNRGLSIAAKLASREFNKHLDGLISNRESIRFHDSLLPQFVAQKERFPEIDPGPFFALVRSILFELAGAMIILVGLSFCNILEALLRQNILLQDFARDTQGPNGAAVIDEALRLNSTTANLFRRVSRPVTVAGAAMHHGDYVCMLIKRAGADDAAYSHPERMHPDPLRPYLTFGRGPHACYGQYWARAILAEMFVALASLPNSGPKDAGAAQMGMFAHMPDYLAWKYG
jgi:cytochrome P450